MSAFDTSAGLIAGAAPTVERVVDILVSDHTMPGTQGRLRALTMNPSAPGFLRQLAETPCRRLPKTQAFTSRAPNPPDPAGTRARSRDLTHGEAVWITTLPTNPADISDDDARALASIGYDARSEGDRRLVASRLEPLRAHDEARREMYAAEVELMHLPLPADPTRLPVWPGARRHLAERIQRDFPGLETPEAEARATRLVQEAWKPNSGRRNELRARIGQLARDHGVKAAYFNGTERWGVAGDDNQTRLHEAPMAA